MNIFSLLLLAFVAVPVIEIYLFIEVGGLIGTVWTIALVIITAILGANLLRQQGLSTLMRARQQMDQAQLPARELVEGMILVFCGGLLLTPGFFTDALGFALLVPAIRGVVAMTVLRRVVVTGAGAAGMHRPGAGQRPGSGPGVRPGPGPGSSHGSGPASGPRPGAGRGNRGDIIDGEFRRDDD